MSSITSTLSAAAQGTTPTATAVAATDNTTTASQDRFLKLLVAQLSNQDPLNPMDNAQMTSQLAQINTASGISDLNSTLKNVSQQIGSQMLVYGASLVGHEVLSSGNTLDLKDGAGQAGFDLSAEAQSVQVVVRTAGGQLVDTLNLGSLGAGRQTFTWNAPDGTPQGAYTFDVKAKTASQSITATPLSRSTIHSVALDGSGLRISTSNQRVLGLSDLQTIF